MTEPAQEYSYLAFSLGLLLLTGALALAWTGPPRAQGRRTLWLSFLLCAPFALFSFEFIPKYWNPRVVWWLGPTSLEDILFTAAVGGIGWFAAAWPLRAALRHALLEDLAGRPHPVPWPRLLLRYALGAAPGIAVAYAIGLGIAGTPVMTAVLWGIGAGGTVLLWRQRRLWRLALSGALAFGLAYSLFVKLTLALAPGFIAAWGIAYQPHVWLWGIPLYEMLWAMAFGAVWPLFTASCLGTELERAPR